MDRSSPRLAVRHARGERGGRLSAHESPGAADAAEAPLPGNLDAPIRDGAWFSVMLGTGETYLAPFGVFLQATTMQVGLLNSLPPLLGAIAQGAGVWLMERCDSRRRLIASGAALQALAWVLLAMLPFAVGPGKAAVALLIAIATYYYVTGNHVGPAWNSLIGELVPASMRGRYFGKRNQINGLATFASMLAAGGVLELAETQGHAAAGFALIFAGAFAARCMSACWLASYDDPPFEIGPEDRFTFFQFLSRAPYSNFAKFVLFVSLMNAAAAFSGAYFTLYLLRDLHFSYLEYTLITAATTITHFLTMQHWGRLADSLGNKKILTVCGWGVCVIPLLISFSTSLVYLIAVQVYAGFVWAGFTLATSTFMFDAVTPPKRARCAAYQAISTAAFTFIGTAAGGHFAAHAPAAIAIGGWLWAPHSPLVLLFLVSFGLRALAALVFMPLFREVRDVEPVGGGELMFRVARLRPAVGVSPPARTRPTREA